MKRKSSRNAELTNRMRDDTAAAIAIPFTDRRLERDLPGPLESAEARRERLAHEGVEIAAFVAESFRHALWAAERIVRTSPDTMPDAARRTAALVLADVAHTATYQCERIALREPRLINDVPRLAGEWPVLCSLHGADNAELIRTLQKALSMKRGRTKVPSMARKESNLNWVLWQVVRWGSLPYRGRFVSWPEHPRNAWPAASSVPLAPFSRDTFKVWFQGHFRPFLTQTTGTPGRHPAFRRIARRALSERAKMMDGTPTRGIRWSDIRSAVWKSLDRLGLIVHGTPD